MKRNVALEIGPMMSLLSLVDNGVIILYYAILHYTITYTRSLRQHHY